MDTPLAIFLYKILSRFPISLLLARASNTVMCAKLHTWDWNNSPINAHDGTLAKFHSEALINLINIRILGNITLSDLLQKFIFKTSHARSPTRCNAAPTWLPTMQNRLCRIVMLVNLKRNKHRCGKAQLVKYQSVYLSRRLLQQSYEYPTAACSMGPSAIPFLSISPGLPYTILEFSTKLLTACEAHWNQLYDSSIPIPSCKSQCWRYAFSPKARRGTRGPSLHHPILWIVVFRIPCLCRLFHAQSSESRLYQSCCIRWWRCKHLCHLSVLARQSTSYLHLLCMHWHGSRYG